MHIILIRSPAIPVYCLHLHQQMHKKRASVLYEILHRSGY